MHLLTWSSYDTNTKEEQQKNEHEIWNAQDKQVQNSSILSYNPLCFNTTWTPVHFCMSTSLNPFI